MKCFYYLHLILTCQITVQQILWEDFSWVGGSDQTTVLTTNQSCHHPYVLLVLPHGSYLILGIEHLVLESDLKGFLVECLHLLRGLVGCFALLFGKLVQII